MARPSDYTEQKAIEICTWLVEGKSIASYCKQDNTPSIQTIYTWLNTHKEFLELYTRAREDQADTLADEIIDIADDGRNDKYKDDNGYTKTDQDVIARSRLRVEARKWVAAKLKPKKYGDKLDLNGDMNHNVQITKMVIELVDSDGG